jgi:iduronate 2-sulfatase
VGFNKPHVPFAAPKAYKELFAAVEFPPTGDDMPLNVDRTGPAHNKWGDVKKFEPLVSMNAFTDIMPQSVKDSISMGYKATTTFSDEMLGRVVNALGCLADDTHIFVWGDQGWHLGEQGLWGKNSMFDAVLQSPLIISPAGHVGELVQSTVVESVDILPTMMAMVGIERGDAMLDGRSLVSLFNENAEDRIAYSIGARGKYMAYSIRTSRYRYTEWIDLNASPNMFANLNLTALPDMHITTLLATGAATRTEWTELYDFAQGPTEVENIVGTASARIVEELAELLRIKTHGPRTQW